MEHSLPRNIFLWNVHIRLTKAQNGNHPRIDLAFLWILLTFAYVPGLLYFFDKEKFLYTQSFFYFIILPNQSFSSVALDFNLNSVIYYLYDLDN